MIYLLISYMALETDIYNTSICKSAIQLKNFGLIIYHITKRNLKIFNLDILMEQMQFLGLAFLITACC